MYLDYEPMTEEQIDKMGLLPPGRYRFRCVEATPKLSKQNNPMIQATLQIKHEDGSVHNLIAYLGTNGKFMMRMLRHYCEATGKMKEYDAKKVDHTTIHGTEGLVLLDIKKGGPRFDDPTRNYDDQNNIVDYFKMDASIGADGGMKPLPKAEDEFNDTINF